MTRTYISIIFTFSLFLFALIFTEVESRGRQNRRKHASREERRLPDPFKDSLLHGQKFAEKLFGPQQKHKGWLPESESESRESSKYKNKNKSSQESGEDIDNNFGNNRRNKYSESKQQKAVKPKKSERTTTCSSVYGCGMRLRSRNLPSSKDEDEVVANDQEDKPSATTQRNTPIDITESSRNKMKLPNSNPIDNQQQIEHFKRLESKIEQLSARVEHIYQMERKKNLIFYGISEVANESPSDRDGKIQEIVKKLGITNLDYDESYRLGKFDVHRAKPRPMLIKFLRFRDKQTVMAERSKLAAEKIFINDDGDSEIRKIQMQRPQAIPVKQLNLINQLQIRNGTVAVAVRPTTQISTIEKLNPTTIPTNKV